MSKYPELIDSIEAVLMMVKGAKMTIPEEATHFCSIKENGREFNLYLRERAPLDT